MSNALTDYNNPRKPDYTDLQERVDALVGKFGLEKAVEIIDSFSKNANSSQKHHRKLKLIKDYIIAETIIVFDLDENEFFTSELIDYREARMACYHLLDKYTQNSHAKIAAIFGKKRNSALYFIHKCKNILSIAHCYPNFTEKYKAVENSTIHFITNLK